MKKSALLSIVSVAALLAVQHQSRATEVIYNFDDGTLNGFTANQRSVTVSTSTTTGVTTAPDAMELSASTTQTYGDALTATIPADFTTSSTFNIDVTVGTAITSTYYDVQFAYNETDGTLVDSYSINLGGVAAGTYTYTVNNTGFSDPDGGSAGTPAAVLAEDETFDASNGYPAPTLNSFELIVDHGPGVATQTYFDNVTVPTPEPTSIAGLILGGSALVARRRRQA